MVVKFEKEDGGDVRVGGDEEGEGKWRCGRRRSTADLRSADMVIGCGRSCRPIGERKRKSKRE